MGILHQKVPYYSEKALAYRGKAGQNADIAFLALRLGVVLFLPSKRHFRDSQAFPAPSPIDLRAIRDFGCCARQSLVVSGSF